MLLKNINGNFLKNFNTKICDRFYGNNKNLIFFNYDKADKIEALCNEL